MREVHLEQGSSDWLEWRRQGIGGSDAYIISEDVDWQSPDDLLNVKLGRKVNADNFRMARGRRLEPTARRLYQEITGVRVRPVCVVHDKHPWMRASLDGLSEDGKIVLEIKCPSEKAHLKALEGVVPDYYRNQLQHQLAVTDAPVLHYWSYNPDGQFKDAPHRQTALVVVYPNPEAIKRLIRRELRFLARLKLAQNKALGISP